MHIDKFEQYFPSKIAARGYDYYVDGHVEELLKTNSTTWTSLVEGATTFYSVIVKVHKNGTIVEASCNCPYEDDCKHIAATLHAVRHELLSSTNYTTNALEQNNSAKNIKQLLQKQTKQQLLDLLLNVCEVHPHIKTALEMQLNPPKDELAIAKQLIEQHLSKAQDRSGFIYWKDVDDAMYGVDFVLSEAEQALHLAQPMKALQLALLCFRSTLSAISYADDSSGAIDERIYASSALLLTVTKNGIGIWTDTEEQQAYKLIIAETTNSLLKDWSNFKIELLKCCLPLCLNNQIEIQHLAYLQSLKKQWRDDHDQSELLTLEHDIIALKKGASEANHFLEQHISNDNIRRQLIRQAAHENNFEKVLQLAQEGFNTTPYLGYKCHYLQDQFEAFEALNNIEAMKNIGHKLIAEGYIDYYEKLKPLYSKQQWDHTKEGLLDALQKKSSYYYFSLIEKERHLPRILQYCEENPQTIINVGALLTPVYRDRVQLLFIKFIEQSAAAATSRNKYYNLTQYIKAFRTAGFDKQASTITKQLLEAYPKRTAMHDEFQKHLY